MLDPGLSGWGFIVLGFAAGRVAKHGALALNHSARLAVIRADGNLDARAE